MINPFGQVPLVVFDFVYGAFYEKHLDKMFPGCSLSFNNQYQNKGRIQYNQLMHIGFNYYGKHTGTTLSFIGTVYSEEKYIAFFETMFNKNYRPLKCLRYGAYDITG